MMKKRNLWRGIEAVPTLAAVLNEWKREIGGDFERARPFLQATTDHSAEHPCMNRPDCGCVHRVAPPGRRTGLVAACGCGCPVFSLEPKDVVVFALDVAKLGDTARRALKFAPPASSAGHGHCRRVGAAGDAQLPVFFCVPADDAALVRELDGLLAAKAGPFIVLTPTAAHHSAVVESMQGRDGFLVLALSQWLALTGVGVLTLRAPIEGVLAAFYRRLAERGGLVKTVERIDRNLEAVAKQNQELRAAKARLEAMQGENLFKFVQKIDARAFRVVCAVLVHGDVAKAARALDMSDSTLREFMRTWKRRGGAYLGLLEIVQWRKRRRVTGTVPFNDALLCDKGVEGQRESVLKEVLDGLLSMTEGNWQDVCAELEVLLREQLGR